MEPKVEYTTTTGGVTNYRHDVPSRCISVGIDDDWTTYTDMSVATKHRETINALAEFYPEVLADLVLRGVII